MAPPIPFAFRIQPNLDPAEALSSDDSHVWIAELPAEGLRVTGALPVRLIRTGCRVSGLACQIRCLYYRQAFADIHSIV